MGAEKDLEKLGLPSISVRERTADVLITEKPAGIPKFPTTFFTLDVERIEDILRAPTPEIKMGSVIEKPNGVFEFTDEATGATTTFRAEEVASLSVETFIYQPTAEDIRSGLKKFPRVIWIMSLDGLLSIELEKL